MKDRTIIVGVTTHQPSMVVRVAAHVANNFEAVLVCAHVDAGAYVVQQYPDGSVDSRPIDADTTEWNGPIFDPEMADRITAWTAAEPVRVEFRELAGDIAHALGRLAEVLGSEMIVVGSHRGGLRSSMHDFFGGSVAVHLAHRQPRPLLVVPLSPAAEGALPWETE